MRCFLAATLTIGLLGQASEAFAYACNDNYYRNASGHVVHSPSCGIEDLRREAICRDGRVSFFRASSRNMLASRRRGALGVSATYRLQFLGASTAHGAPVLAETSPAAASIEAAVGHAVEVEWLPGAHTLRLVDLDGREVYQRHLDHIRGLPGGR